MIYPARASWFDEVRSSSPRVDAVAVALGLEVRGRRFGPCPACGKENRHHHPCTIHGDTWMCAHCKEKGGVAQLAAVVLTGSRKPAVWHDVRAFFAAHGWCSAWKDRVAFVPRPAPPRVETELPLPPKEELLALLHACRLPETAPELFPWFRERGWNRRLPAGILPDLYRWPAWWRFREWRLVVSMVTPDGAVASMHGRVPGRDTPKGKTRWPFSCRSKGLLFASPLARQMLRGATSPPRVLVVEGVTSYLSACCWAPPDVAVLGADNGGWPALAQARITGEVWMAPDCGDPDRTGERYWMEGKRAVPRARRVLLPGRMDVADLLHPRARCSFEDLLTMTAT